MIGRLAKRLLPSRQTGPRVNAGATFLLGVGCQKGGTTWLHDYLSHSPAVDLGMVKEYHVWDVVDLRDDARRSAMLENVRVNAEKEREDGVESINQLRQSFHCDFETYFDYFTEKLSRPGVILTGDLTPSYSGLSAERFRMIKDSFARRGVPVKVIFLMRDPVERVWSAARMKLWGERTEARRDDTTPRSGDERTVIRTYRAAATHARTDYHRTAAALEQVFAATDIHYELYERLFSYDSTTKISAFLGIPHLDPELDKGVNTAPKAAPLSDRTIGRVAREYAEVYRFAVDRFGRETIAQLWPHLAQADRTPSLG